MKQEQGKKALSLKNLTRSNIWDIQENDVFRLLEGSDKDGDLKDNINHYTDIIRSAFTIELLENDATNVKIKYEKLGYKLGTIKIDENTKLLWAIKKRPIMRVTDLTYENIRHISAAKLIEVLDRNFGGGWDSLSQSLKDIIESGFDISTTTLPKDRLHKTGGMYEKKIADGFEVLEISKGSWVEAIFAKEKPIMERPHMKFDDVSDNENEDEDDEEIEKKHHNDNEEDDDEDMNEENYRTTFNIEKGPSEENEEEEISLDEE
jgi:hypothetical protein